MGRLVLILALIPLGCAGTQLPAITPEQAAGVMRLACEQIPNPDRRATCIGAVELADRLCDEP
jgi:hypothetical protein